MLKWWSTNTAVKRPEIYLPYCLVIKLKFPYQYNAIALFFFVGYFNKTMQRRKFIAKTAATIPALAFGQQLPAQQGRADKGFVVRADKGRGNEHTILGGSSPNDIKVSANDTRGELAIFEYTGNVKGGPPLHIHHKQDEIFFIVEGDYYFFASKSSPCICADF